MITELDIEAAVLAVNVAAQDVADAEKLPPGPGVGAMWSSAHGRLRHAVAVHARLVEQRAAELAAEEAFSVAEKAAGKRIAAMAKEETVSRGKLADAVGVAQAALVSLVVAIDERNATVSGHAVELADLGLTLAEGAEHESGVTRGGAVQLHGEWWCRADSAALLALVVERVKAARFGAHGGPEIADRRMAKVLGLAGRADLGLDALELPPAVQHTQPAIERGDIPLGAPVGIRERDRAREMQLREIKYTADYSDQKYF